MLIPKIAEILVSQHFYKCFILFFSEQIASFDNSFNRTLTLYINQLESFQGFGVAVPVQNNKRVIREKSQSRINGGPMQGS